VNKDQKGYIEDRRPNANMDPYVVTRLIIETVCGTADGDLQSADGKVAAAAAAR
jgi:glutamine synthetase